MHAADCIISMTKLELRQLLRDTNEQIKACKAFNNPEYQLTTLPKDLYSLGMRKADLEAKLLDGKRRE